MNNTISNLYNLKLLFKTLYIIFSTITSLEAEYLFFTLPTLMMVMQVFIGISNFQNMLNKLVWFLNYLLIYDFHLLGGQYWGAATLHVFRRHFNCWQLSQHWSCIGTVFYACTPHILFHCVPFFYETFRYCMEEMFVSQDMFYQLMRLRSANVRDKEYSPYLPTFLQLLAYPPMRY